VIQHAAAEAKRLNHDHVGTEHLLAGLAQVEQGISSAILAELGVTGPDVQELVKEVAGTGTAAHPRERTTMTRGAGQALALAYGAARQRGHRYIDTAHLLLGLIQAEGGLASEILDQMDVSPEDLRREVEAHLNRGPSHKPQAEGS